MRVIAKISIRLPFESIEALMEVKNNLVDFLLIRKAKEAEDNPQ